jgi:hypothetical protein
VHEIDEETVVPGNPCGPRFDPREVRTTKAEFGQDKSERPGGVRSGNDDRGLVILVVDNGVTDGKNDETSRVVLLVENVVKKNLEPVRRACTRRSQSGNRQVTCLGDLSDSTRCVMRWDRLDTEGEKGVLCLCKRLRVRTHFTHIVDGGAGNTVERVAYLDEVLSEDGEPNMALITWETIEHRKHRTRRGVLDRHNEPIHLTTLERVEHGSETSMPNVLPIGKQLRRCAIAVAVPLALISDLHSAKPSYVRLSNNMAMSWTMTDSSAPISLTPSSIMT